MNRFFKILICILIVLSVVALVLFGMFAYGMATRGNVPKYEPGSVWYNEETGIILTADDDGVLEGKNVICGKEYDLCVGYLSNRIFLDYEFYDEENGEEGYTVRGLLQGNYKYKKDKLIIKNIDYYENIGINADKLVFVKQ